MSSWVGPAIQAGGAVLGGALGGKGSSSGGTPKWYKKNAQYVFDTAKNFANQPFTPYSGDRVAPFSADTLAAMDMMRQRVGEDPYAGAISNAQGMLGYQPQQIQTQYDAPQFAGQDISPYMNPFIGNVVDTSLSDIERSRQMAETNTNAAATAAGAFGGSRSGVANALTNENYSRQAADTAAQLRMAGYTDAANRLENDLARQWAATQLGQQSAYANQQAGLQGQNLNLMANNQYGNMIGAQQAQQNNALGALMTSGLQQQQYQQNLLDVPYQNYLTQQDWPLRQLGMLTGAMGGAMPTSGVTMGGGAAGVLGGAQLGGQVGSGLYDLWGNIFGSPTSPAITSPGGGA